MKKMKKMKKKELGLSFIWNMRLKLRALREKLAKAESLILAQSLAINESIEILINTSNGFIPTPTWDRINDFLDKPKPSPELGAKIVETLEFYAQGNEWDYGKKSEETLRLIREQGKETKNG